MTIRTHTAPSPGGWLRFDLSQIFQLDGSGISLSHWPQPSPVMRHTTRRAWWTIRPAVLKIRKRSRFGRAVEYSSGSAMRLRAVIKLWVRIDMRNHAALAPKRPHGNTPAASSFFRMSWIASIVPAFSRCHYKRVLAFHSHRFVITAKYLCSLPSANSSPCRLLTRMASHRSAPNSFSSSDSGQ